MPYLGAQPDKGNFADLNGAKLILDADADTSITSDTDDQIDIEIAGSDELKITAAMFAPASADGSALGGSSNEWSDLYLADSGVIYFGADQEVKVTHVADTGLTLKHTATADDKPISLTLQTGETDMAANDIIGAINFQAPDEGTGTDAILVSAAIKAFAEGDHSSSSNATTLGFYTGASEAAAIKMGLTSGGDVNVLTDGASIFFGADSEIELRHVADDGLILKHVGTGDGKEPSLTFQAGDNDIAADDILGSILFQAPDEGAGTDAILVAAGIQARSEGNFSSSNNATSLDIMTGSSEAAATKWTFASDGSLRTGTGQLMIGRTAGVTEIGGTQSTLNVFGTATADSTMTVARWSADAVAPRIIGFKSRHASIGSTAIVQDDDALLEIIAYADDAASDYFEAGAAMIRMSVNGTPGTNDMPGEISFHCSSDSSQNLAKRWTIDAVGDLIGAGGQEIFLGDTTNAGVSTGMTLNQGASDDEIFALKSSDIAHGLTSRTETDTYFAISKSVASDGGVLLEFMSENTRDNLTAGLFAYGDPTQVTTKTNSNYEGMFNLSCFGHDNSNAVSSINANGGLFVIKAYNGSSSVSKFGVDFEGDLHVDGSTSLAAMDEYDDAALIRSLEINRSADKIIRTEFDNWVGDHMDILVDAKIIGEVDPDDPTAYHDNGELSTGMLNVTGLQRLQNGAIVQQRAMFETLKSVAEEMLPGFAKKLNERLEAQSLPALPV